jgi:transcriptional regulator with GAF, ATPase, and Fis domain
MSVPPQKKPVPLVQTNGSASIACWIKCWALAFDFDKETFTKELTAQHINLAPPSEDTPDGAGICLFGQSTPELEAFIQRMSRAGRERIIAIAAGRLMQAGARSWDLLHAGASDVLVWSDAVRVARQVRARLERWLLIDRIIEDPDVAAFVVGKSTVWRAILRRVVEIARFSDAPALLLGESGTGKEVVARLIHQLDPRPAKRDLVILDCSTVVPELSGSEFFGHERGAFTGAVSERDGAFALANGGTLFLDEIGEMPLPLQAQLLRVVQERTYKRVGGNTWHKTSFRLVCATNRDLRALVDRGQFRADLYYRIASFVCKLPPLRERTEDIVPLAEHFLRELHHEGEPPELDATVRDYLIRREYPGNVRDLRHAVARLMYRYAGDGTLTVGTIPSEERPVAEPQGAAWQDADFERAIRRAVLFGVRLKEIGRAAEDAAIQIATDEEGGNLSRAARRLGVTDRALQLRRANQRQVEEIEHWPATSNPHRRVLDSMGSMANGREFVTSE